VYQRRRDLAWYPAAAYDLRRENEIQNEKEKSMADNNFRDHVEVLNRRINRFLNETAEREREMDAMRNLMKVVESASAAEDILNTIESKKATLEKEIAEKEKSLKEIAHRVDVQRTSIAGLDKQIAARQQTLDELEGKIASAMALIEKADRAREALSALQTQ
jgi:septal ring factor EnvC (AmiA/AmiB activator)